MDNANKRDSNKRIGELLDTAHTKLQTCLKDGFIGVGDAWIAISPYIDNSPTKFRITIPLNLDDRNTPHSYRTGQRPNTPPPPFLEEDPHIPPFTPPPLFSQNNTIPLTLPDWTHELLDAIEICVCTPYPQDRSKAKTQASEYAKASKILAKLSEMFGNDNQSNSQTYIKYIQE